MQMQIDPKVRMKRDATGNRLGVPSTTSTTNSREVGGAQRPELGVDDAVKLSEDAVGLGCCGAGGRLRLAFQPQRFVDAAQRSAHDDWAREEEKQLHAGGADQDLVVCLLRSAQHEREVFKTILSLFKVFTVPLAEVKGEVEEAVGQDQVGKRPRTREGNGSTAIASHGGYRRAAGVARRRFA